MHEASTSDETGKGVPAHAVDAGSGEQPHPGDIVIDRDLGVAPEPLVGADVSTALDEDESGTTIPPAALWAMKDRRHTQWHLLASSERHQRLRQTFGDGPGMVHAIDDGRHHAMIGRIVGTTGGDVSYCLVGRVTREHLSALESGSVPTEAAFAVATEITLCGVAIEVGVESSNVFDVSRYATGADIPEEYLPGVQEHHFGSPLEITIY